MPAFSCPSSSQLSSSLVRANGEKEGFSAHCSPLLLRTSEACCCERRASLLLNLRPPFAVAIGVWRRKRALGLHSQSLPICVVSSPYYGQPQCPPQYYLAQHVAPLPSQSPARLRAEGLELELENVRSQQQSLVMQNAVLRAHTQQAEAQAAAERKARLQAEEYARQQESRRRGSLQADLEAIRKLPLK